MLVSWVDYTFSLVQIKKWGCFKKMLKVAVRATLESAGPSQPPFSLIAESKMIEKHGGYKFTAPVVPSTFNFGGSAPGMN